MTKIFVDLTSFLVKIRKDKKLIVEQMVFV